MERDNGLKIESYRAREKQLKRSQNTFLYMFLAIFFGGYLIFFTSSLWLPNTYLGVDVTPIGQEVTLGDRVVAIDSWTFAKEEKKMEILVEIDNNSIDGIDSYLWTVKTKDGKLPVKVIYDTPEFVVLHVSDVPKDVTELSLNMTLSEEDRETSEDFEPFTFYVNDKMIESVGHIKEKKFSAYQKQAYEHRITTYEDEIRTMRAQIRELDVQIDEANKKIAKIKADMEYQTETEIMESESLIEDLKNKRSTLKESKSDLEGEISELQLRIQMEQERLDDM